MSPGARRVRCALATHRRGGTASQRGFALLIVLWSLVLIALLVTQVTATGRSEAVLAGNLRRAAALRAETDGAVQEAAFHLLDAAAPWTADASVHVLREPGAAVSIRIVDEAGKINPNHASPAVLAALLRVSGQSAVDADRIASEIVQWRFPSADPPATGAKAQRYRAAGKDYAPPNADFETVSEVGLVLGMTPTLLARLTPFLTVYTDTDPDPRLAGPVVAAALASVGTPVPTGPLPPPRVVTVTATGVAPEGGEFIRRAVVSLGPDRAGALFRIVTWDAPPA
jgi:general secretion pathway protein K